MSESKLTEKMEKNAVIVLFTEKHPDLETVAFFKLVLFKVRSEQKAANVDVTTISNRKWICWWYDIIKVTKFVIHIDENLIK